MSEFPKVDDALLKRLDVPVPRYTSYPTAPVWSESIGRRAYAEALREAAKKVDQPLSIYVHIPFCRERCSFCGCNVVISRTSSSADAYLAQLVREMDQVAELLGERRDVAQIHWGGGTPTFLDEGQIQTLWSAITRRFRVLPDAEVAIEIDPKVTSRSQVKLLRSLGFNRMSMGVQDLDPAVQDAISRIQSVEETREALTSARELGFRGINFDLIYGLPRQNRERWQKTLDQVVEMSPDRMAVYAFANVPDVRPNQKRLPQAEIPHGTAKLELFRMAWETFTSAGYRPIGMDHFARADDELALAQARRSLTRNFQGYTVRAAGDVVAFGVSAISDVGGVYAQNTHSITKYKDSVSSGELATERGFRSSDDDVRRRGIITNIMCNFHVDLGPKAQVEFAGELKRLKEMEGLVEVHGSEVDVTPLGRIFVRNVASTFDAYLLPGERPFSRAV
ncbi:MAG TPA: oxygen-independent coproporphyrinogen III oxidase [Myxococcales bacterium]|nr:oxygen-independent coproporphyrinogen III oxidase [Myxococcales bacterium]